MQDELIGALVGAALGVIATYVAAVVKYRQDVRRDYDKQLRAERLPPFTALWKLTEMFPKYGRTGAVHFGDLERFAVCLRDWYFDGGGMYLSNDGRDAYFALHEAIKQHRQPEATATDEVIPGPVYEEIRSACSSVRTALVGDLGSRREPEIVAA